MSSAERIQQIETKLPPLGNLPLIEHPDDLQKTWENLQIFRIEPHEIPSGYFLAALFQFLDARPWLIEYPNLPHGSDDPRHWLRSCTVEEMITTMQNWADYQKEFTETTILGIFSHLEGPQSAEESETLLFLDLEGKPNQETLEAIEKTLTANKFPGAIVYTGASYHYIALFRAKARTAHRFHGRLIRILTPRTVPAAVLCHKIGLALENADSYEEAKSISRAILDPSTPLFVPSVATGFQTGSNADVRYVARRMLHERIGKEGAFVLRISEKPERIAPYIASLIHP